MGDSFFMRSNMKKSMLLAVAMTLVICLLSVSCATKALPEKDEERTVVAVFAKEDAQAYTYSDGERDYLDTLWVYYSDGTFRQYAELGDDVVLFSCGTYSLVDGDFIYGSDEEDFGDIVIKRERKYVNGELTDYSSEHTYDLGSLGFVQLYAYGTDPSSVEAVFYGLDKQLLVNTEGENDFLDTCWIYYSDMTFEQYAVVGDEMVLFSRGTYSFADDGDFIYEMDGDDYGDIVISRTHKYSTSDGLVEYQSSHVYDLGSLGFEQIVSPVL